MEIDCKRREVFYRRQGVGGGEQIADYLQRLFPTSLSFVAPVELIISAHIMTIFRRAAESRVQIERI